MRVMLVDDGRLALTQLECYLSLYEELEIIGCYQNAKLALDDIKYKNPDVIFLDIQMPELDGIEAALQIVERWPHIEIVFVTANNQYAVKAFELNAVDYLLKPLSRTRLELTVRRLLNQKRIPSALVNSTDNPVAAGAPAVIGICCFQTLRFVYGGDRPPEIPQWRTAKSQELFAYLLYNRGEMIRKSTLLELMWPDLDIKKAMTHLYTTVYLVRQCLSKAGANIQIKNVGIQEGYVLDAGDTMIDTVAWEQELCGLNGPIEETHERLFSLLASYQGDYLAEYNYWWAEAERERLYQVWLKHAVVLADYYADSGSEYAKAAALYKQLAERDSYNENIAFKLLKLYDRLGETEKVKAYYLSFKNRYTNDLEFEMPGEIVAWYESRAAGAQMS